MKSLIFNIQKFSLHDGPGIRTVVFFKGCPLRCQWCANPESQNFNMEILWDNRKCIHCKTCVKVCDSKAISLKNGSIKVSKEKCNACEKCLEACKMRALSKEGEYKDIAEIINICKQDTAFYEESKGGVTLSGGEVLVHEDFALNLLIALKKEKIHTAVETTGFVKREIFNKLAQYIDLFLFDIKHWDSRTHKIKTGVDNRLILDNLSCAIKNKYNVLPRIPVIPGFNSSLEDAQNFSELFNRIGILQVQLLPFHQFGEKKYEMLNREYKYKDIKALYAEDLNDYQKVFFKNNINAFF